MEEKISMKIIEPVLKSDSSIDKHLENLHTIMFHWLTTDGRCCPDDQIFSYTETYEDLRMLLKNLKPIENLLKTNNSREGLN